MENQTRPARLRLAALATALFALTAALLTKTWGLQLDEVVYLQDAAITPLGDSPQTGKPYFYYALNYLLHWGAHPLLGALTPSFLFLAYCWASAAAAEWLANRVARDSKEYLWLMALLATAPLFVLCSTQLMMETPQFALACLIIGSLLDLAKGKKKPGTHAAVFAATLACVAIKETALGGLFILGLAFTPSLKKNALGLWAGMLAGLATTWALRVLAQLPDNPAGGLAELLTFSSYPKKLSTLAELALTWLFYLGPIGLAWLSRLKPADTLDRILRRCIFLSLALIVPVLAASSFYRMARYHYLSFWIGLIALSILAATRSKLWVRGLILAQSLALVATMYGSRPFATWPSIVTSELYYSPYTVFTGTPIHSWLLRSTAERRNMCAHVTRADSEHRWITMRFFKAVASGELKTYDERQLEDFDSCDGPKAYVRRHATTEPRPCEQPCPAGSYRWQSCLSYVMMIGAASKGRPYVNQVCLP